ncbi:uncharacterized protein TOT_040000810 [Theileria orientalis strain Shintoku]|uniref:Uncharacterized protein n=1 Tax=Theileria orientalis strain Shintoku TaxID=869250 RepID=J7M8N2_THEOR|nr:uncharacterized protein TOT_040000810 [Theileria orientalis strain Shintoku]BAM42443.1 uncharacterized protein TOT_040000810 [Theileria orientalis strain Shintoku]|eukprot:XP_009692744.1 uncharacterized protein TOT_040000810 [Theileria orientalis strain Shintoku]
MNLLSWYEALALVLLWKLDLFTCIEISSSRVPAAEQTHQFLSAQNKNNSNNRYYGGRYGHRHHRRSRYHVANRGKIPPEPPPRIHPRLRPRNYSSYEFGGYGPTHFRSDHSSSYSTYENDSYDGNFISLDISRNFSNEGYTISYENDLIVFRSRPPYLFSDVRHGHNRLWQYKGDGYPNMVTYREINGRPKVDVHFPGPPRRTAGKYRPPGFLYTNRDFVPSQQTSSFRVNVPHIRPTQPLIGQDVLEFELLTVGDKVVLRPKLYPSTGVSSSVLITVNIDRFESTDQLMYTYDPRTGIHSLKAREPFLINEILQKGQIIWRAKDNKYGDRVILRYDEDGNPRSRVLFPDWAVLGMPPPSLQPFQVPQDTSLKTDPQSHEYSPQTAHYDYEHLFKTTVPKNETARDEQKDHSEEHPPHSTDLPPTIDTSFQVHSTPPLKSADKKPYELDLNNRIQTDQFEYNFDSQSKTMTYIGKSLYRFSAVKYGANVLWRTDIPAEYANKVIVNGYEHRGMFMLSIFLDACVKRFYKDESAPWTEFDTTKPNALALNVYSNFETFFYTVRTAGVYKTYTVKEGFKFYKVRLGDHDLWETTDTEALSSKVVTEGDNRVTIHLDNEKIVTFARVRHGCHGCKGFFCGLMTCGLYNCCCKSWREVK